MEAEIPRFHVFNGSTRLVIEANDQEDALGLPPGSWIIRKAMVPSLEVLPGKA